MTPPDAACLPVRIPPLPDELFSSWVVRLAAAHGLKVRSLCSLLVHKQVEFNFDLDGAAGDPLLRVLAARTGRDAGPMIAGHTLAGLGGRLYPCLNRDKGTPWVLPLGTFHRLLPAVQFCPECLAEEPACFRRIWRLSLFGACPRHGTGLHHVCPQCRAPVHPLNNGVRRGGDQIAFCWRCGLDLRLAPACPVDHADTHLAQAFLRALEGGVLPPGAPSGLAALSYFNGLALLCAQLSRKRERLRRWRELAAEAAGVPTLPPPVERHAHTSFDALSHPALRRPVLRTAGWLLEAWPERFLEVARAAQTRTSDFVSHFVAAPPWFLEPLQTRLTPPRRKPAPTPGLTRVRQMRQLILEHQRDWSPTKLPRLIRALRAAGHYSPETEDGIIMRSLPKTLAKLRAGRADYRRRLTVQVARDTPEWSRLLLLAKPYRKTHCKKEAILRRGIRLLCADRYLSSRDLGELLRRSHVVVMVFHLTPMVRAGELETKFGANRGGARNYPGQAYRSAEPGGALASRADGGDATARSQPPTDQPIPTPPHATPG